MPTWCTVAWSLLHFFVATTNSFSDHEYCRKYCLSKRYGCNDFNIGSNQLLSCAQSCHMRNVLNVTEAFCLSKCDRNMRSGCALVVKQHVYDLCGTCERQSFNRKPHLKEYRMYKCDRGVCSRDACIDGCRVDKIKGGSRTTERVAQKNKNTLLILLVVALILVTLCITMFCIEPSIEENRLFCVKPCCCSSFCFDCTLRDVEKGWKDYVRRRTLRRRQQQQTVASTAVVPAAQEPPSPALTTLKISQLCQTDAQLPQRSMSTEGEEQCYICLEPTTTASSCSCGIPVHQSCAENLPDQTQCTICHTHFGQTVDKA